MRRLLPQLYVDRAIDRSDKVRAEPPQLKSSSVKELAPEEARPRGLIAARRHQACSTQRTPGYARSSMFLWFAPTVSSRSSARFSQAAAFSTARTRQQPGALLWLPKGWAEIDDVSRYASHRYRYAAVRRKLPRRTIPIQRPQIHAGLVDGRARGLVLVAARASDHYRQTGGSETASDGCRTRPRFDVENER